LNGRVIATHPVSEDSKLKTTFLVPYQTGELTAIGLKVGKEVVRQTLKTSGKPDKIRISSEKDTIKADRNDLAYLNIEIIDKAGNLVPDAAIPIRIKVEGTGELQAVGNGNPSDMRSFKKPEITTFKGRCQVILRPYLTRGKIDLTAIAENLPEVKAKVLVQ
jgi:beta-galactosidase